MTDELILHHYDGSPFSEKVRLMLGYKGLAWRSVRIPAILPKPDVTALTGGYRRTPILQIGADVYCDSALIARVLEARAPAPPLFPPEAAGTASILAEWADAQLFWAVIPYAMQPAGVPEIFAGQPPEVVRAFAADRRPFTEGMVRKTPLDAEAALHHYFGRLESRLADGRDYLVRGAPSIADFAVAHCIWYVIRVQALARVFEPCPRLVAWYRRVAAFGHGSPSPLASGDALALAAAATSHAPTAVQAGLGWSPGDPASVFAIDYGRDPVAGTLAGLSDDAVVLERVDPRAGRVHVHFPRIGFQLRRVDA